MINPILFTSLKIIINKKNKNINSIINHTKKILETDNIKNIIKKYLNKI
jgi:hypothetical protein